MAEEDDMERPDEEAQDAGGDEPGAQPAGAQPAEAEEERKSLSWRDLPSVVNLKDFAQMVGSEAEQIGTSLRTSLESLFRLPFGPIAGLFGLFIVSIRSCLLVLVIFVFGTGILLMTIMRALGMITGRRKRDDG